MSSRSVALSGGLPATECFAACAPSPMAVGRGSGLDDGAPPRMVGRRPWRLAPGVPRPVDLGVDGLVVRQAGCRAPSRNIPWSSGLPSTRTVLEPSRCSHRTPVLLRRRRPRPRKLCSWYSVPLCWKVRFRVGGLHRLPGQDPAQFGGADGQRQVLVHRVSRRHSEARGQRPAVARK